jgi:hypothetical protein
LRQGFDQLNLSGKAKKMCSEILKQPLTVTNPRHYFGHMDLDGFSVILLGVIIPKYPQFGDVNHMNHR